MGREPPESPEIGPDTQVKAIDAAKGTLFRLLLRRGLIVSLIPHYGYRLIQQLNRDLNKNYTDICPLGVPGLRWLRFRVEIKGDVTYVSMPSRILRRLKWQIESDEDQAAALVRALVIITEALATGVTIMIASPFYIIGAGLRSLSATFRLALTATPILLAILVVVFTTGDAWRLYGDEPPLRLGALTLVILIVAVLALYRVGADQEGGWRKMVATICQQNSECPKLVVNTKAADLATAGVIPSDITHSEFWDLYRYNVYALFWLAIFGQLVAVAFWISLMFISLGMIIVTQSAASELLLGQPDILWKFSLVGQTFVLSQQLLWLSITLGAVAALTFATIGLQDKNDRKNFFDRSLADLNQGLAMFSYYVGGLNHSLGRLSEQDLRVLNNMGTYFSILAVPLTFLR